MTYDYRCNSCGKEHEIEHSINDQPLTRCPSCEADSMVRLISQGNFVLKGSGWAADNYAKKP